MIKKQKETIKEEWKLFDIIARVKGLPLQGGKIWLSPEYSKLDNLSKLFERYIVYEFRTKKEIDIDLSDVKVIYFKQIRPTKRERDSLYYKLKERNL